MSDNITFIPYDIQKLKKLRLTNKKKAPNMFILFRRDMMINKPPNMTMTNFSKFVSLQWKNLSDYEKAKYQKRSQLIRDLEIKIDEFPRTVECQSCKSGGDK
ncbi:20027_t:CDS:1, partial [Funneliformis geosporum]